MRLTTSTTTTKEMKNDEKQKIVNHCQIVLKMQSIITQKISEYSIIRHCHVMDSIVFVNKYFFMWITSLLRLLLPLRLSVRFGFWLFGSPRAQVAVHSCRYCWFRLIILTLIFVFNALKHTMTKWPLGGPDQTIGHQRPATRIRTHTIHIEWCRR